MAYKAVIKLEMQAKSLEDFYTNLSKISKKNIRSLKALEEQANKTFGGKMRGRIESFGKSMNSLSSKTHGMRIAAAVGFGAAVNTAMSFEKKLFDVQMVFRKTKDEMKSFGVEMRDLAKHTVYTPTGIMSAANELAKMGRSEAKILAIMPDLVKFAQMGEGDLSEQAIILSKAFDNLADKGQTTKSFFNQTAVAINSTSLTMENLSETLKFAAGSMRNYKGTWLDQVTAIGALSDAFKTASIGGTAMRGMFVQMAAPTKEGIKVLERYADAAGVSIDSFMDKGKLKDMPEFLRVLDIGASKAANSGKDLKALFGKITGDAVTSLLTSVKGVNVFLRAKKKIDAAVKTGVNLPDAYALGLDETTFKKLKNFTSQMSELAIAIGESGLLGAVNSVLDSTKPFFEWFSGLTDGTKQAVVYTGLMSAAFLAAVPAITAITNAIKLANLSLGKYAVLAAGAVSAYELTKVTGWTGPLDSLSEGWKEASEGAKHLRNFEFGAAWDKLGKVAYHGSNAMTLGGVNLAETALEIGDANSITEGYERHSKTPEGLRDEALRNAYGAMGNMSKSDRSSTLHRINLTINNGNSAESQTLLINDITSATTTSMNVGEQ